MAIGFGELKSINRAAGRSAVAAAAYRAHERLTDERTGEVFDFTPRRKSGAAESFLIFPDGEKGLDRSSLWNLAEAAENRKNSTTAREWIGALPHEIDNAAQRRISEGFARILTERHGVACDGCIHRNDPQNPHLHLLFTTRRFFSGALSDKTRELDVKGTSSDCVEQMRQAWQDLCNIELKAASVPPVDMRSYARQGIARIGEKKRSRQQSQAIKAQRAANRGERFAQELEREASDLERKARRRRKETEAKNDGTQLRNNQCGVETRTTPNTANQLVAHEHRIGNPWGLGIPTLTAIPMFARTTKARVMPEAIRSKFPHIPPAEMFSRLYPNVVAPFPSISSGTCLGSSVPANQENVATTQAAGGMLPPPSGLSPDAYAAWLYAYKRAISVQQSARVEKRERARFRP